MSSNGTTARTEIIYGTPNIIKRTLHRLSTTSEKIDCCISSSAPEGTVKAEPVFNETIRLKNAGVKIRYITEITQSNLPYCKQLMQTAELRHMDEIKGNFSIVDGRDYQATAAVKEGDPPDESVLSTARAFVDQQQYIFDMLWQKAIPAKQRIKEIEQGAKREFIETIRDPYDIQKFFNGLLKAATEEILLILPTTTTSTDASTKLYRYEQHYLLPLFRNAVVFEIPEYTYEEFEAISVRIIKKLPQNMVIQIASSIWKAGSRDIRDVLKIAKLCNPADTEQDIARFISIHQKYHRTGKDYNR